MLKKAISFLIIFSFLVTPAMADMDDLLDDIIGGVYVSEPGIYKSPTHNTMSLGSMSFRLNKDLLGQPVVSYSSPKASISCAGMDFDAGMMSVLGLDTFETMLSQAGATAAWGVMVGLTYSLPGIGKAFEEIHKYVRQIQSIFQSPCQAGVAAGKTIADSIGLGEQKKAGEKAVGEGSESTFDRAMKSFRKYFKVQDMMMTFPFGPLNQAGITDPSIQSLIATWTGYLDVFIRDPDNNNKKLTNQSNKTMENICGEDGSKCNANSNVGISFGFPLLQSPEAIIYGGSFQQYYCDVMVDDYCKYEIETEYTTINDGLKKKIYTLFKGYRDALASGSGNASTFSAFTGGQTSESIVSYSAFVSNFFDVLSYSAALKKYGQEDMADSVINNAAELAAYNLLYKVGMMAFDIAGAAVGGSYGSQSATSKLNADTLKVYLDNVTAAVQQLGQVIQKLNAINQANLNAFEMYKITKNYIQEQIPNQMGKGTLSYR
jgi:hypothetical protein